MINTLVDLLNTSSNTAAATLAKLSLLQSISTIAFAVGMYVCFGLYEAISAGIGGLIAVSANGYLAVKMRQSVTADSHAVQSAQIPPEGMLQRFYRFEVLKIVFTVTMFVIAVVVVKVAVVPFIVAYLLAALIVTWLSLLVLDQQQI